MSNKTTTSSSILERAGVFDKKTVDKAKNADPKPQEKDTFSQEEIKTEQVTEGQPKSITPPEKSTAITQLSGKKRRGKLYDKQTMLVEKSALSNFNDFVDKNQFYKNEMITEAIVDLLNKYDYYSDNEKDGRQKNL